MRISSKFGERTVKSKSIEVTKKYFLIFEGSATEVQYFNGIIEYRTELGIDDLVTIVPLLRSHNEQSWSNPQKIIKTLTSYLENLDSPISVDALINFIIDYLYEETLIYKNILFDEHSIHYLLEEYFINTFSLNKTDYVDNIEETIIKISNFLKNKFNICDISEHLKQYISDQSINIDYNFDTICLIADRDKQSFKSEQYDKVNKICHDNNYKFYISNPCFELWLLMHFDEILTLDKKTLLNNPKKSVRSKNRFLNVKLSELIHGYSKSNLNFNIFKDKLNIAIKNEKLFCENIDELKNCLGSNVGLLIEELKGKIK